MLQVGSWAGKTCGAILVLGTASECWHLQAARQGHENLSQSTTTWALPVEELFAPRTTAKYIPPFICCFSRHVCYVHFAHYTRYLFLLPPRSSFLTCATSLIRVSARCCLLCSIIAQCFYRYHPWLPNWCIVEVSAVGNLGIIMRKGSKYVEVLES